MATIESIHANGVGQKSSASSANEWYVMRTIGPKTYQAIGEHFIASGMRYFVPTIEVKRKYKDGTTRVVEQAYVGGLFFAFGTEKQILEQIEQSGGRLQWVYQRGQLCSSHMKVPTPEMENFMQGIALRNFKYITLSDVPANVGKRVRVSCKGLADIEGIILPTRRKEKSLYVSIGNILAIQITVTPDVIQVLD